MPACAIFDLDDTLIDTRGVLLPLALERISRATGIPVAELNARGKRVSEVLAPCGDLDPRVRRLAAEAWYSPEVPELTPLPGAKEALEALHGRIALYLVTRGDLVRQEAKVDRTGLRGFFERVIVRAIEEPGSKREDFEQILAQCGAAPASCAVIGDDPDDELAHAHALGCLVIRVPQTPLAEVPARLERAGLLGDRTGS